MVVAVLVAIAEAEAVAEVVVVVVEVVVSQKVARNRKRAASSIQISDWPSRSSPPNTPLVEAGGSAGRGDIRHQGRVLGGGHCLHAAASVRGCTKVKGNFEDFLSWNTYAV